MVARAHDNSLEVAAHAHGAQGVVHAVQARSSHAFRVHGPGAAFEKLLHVLIRICSSVILAMLQAGCRTVEHCTWIAKAGRWGCVDDATVEARLKSSAGRQGKSTEKSRRLRFSHRWRSWHVKVLRLRQQRMRIGGTSLWESEISSDTWHEQLTKFQRFQLVFLHFSGMCEALQQLRHSAKMVLVLQMGTSPWEQARRQERQQAAKQLQLSASGAAGIQLLASSDAGAIPGDPESSFGGPPLGTVGRPASRCPGWRHRGPCGDGKEPSLWREHLGLV